MEVVQESPYPKSFEYLTLTPYIAAITSNVVRVRCLHHAVALSRVTAKLIADLDMLSDGRVVFCVSAGVSLSKFIFETLGLDFDRRSEISDEYTEAGDCSLSSNFVKFKGLAIYPTAVQKPLPPIWLAVLTGMLGE